MAGFGAQRIGAVSHQHQVPVNGGFGLFAAGVMRAKGEGLKREAADYFNP
jgi:hypothetical protein